MGNSKKQPTQRIQRRDVNASERVSLAIDLLKKRLSYDEIAKRCGYADRGSAHKAVQRELQRRIHPKIDEYREQELSILDEIHQKVWGEAFEKKDKDGNTTTNLWAVDRLLELSKDRRKLLNLDVQPEEIAASQVIIREVPVGLLPVAKVVEGSSEHSS